jgi:putative transposase
VCKERRRSYHKIRNMRRAAERLMRRMRSLISELHHRAARDLCNNYNVILLPEYEVSHMVRHRHRLTGATRKINAAAVRGLLAWRPYQFKQFLLHKAREYLNCTVVIVNEV